MTKLFASIFLFCLFLTPLYTHAEELDKNTAQMQAMDKITGRVSVINVPVGGEIKFGSLSIVVRKCQTRPMEETPDNFAFVDISDTSLQGDEFNIFKGWMISSSPATHAVEHPIYDVWLLKCRDSQIDKTQLLSEEQLAARDNLPIQHNTRQTVAKEDNENTTTLADSQLLEMQAQEEPQNSASAAEMSAVEFLYDEEDEETSEDGETAENTDAESRSETKENTENSN